MLDAFVIVANPDFGGLKFFQTLNKTYEIS